MWKSIFKGLAAVGAVICVVGVVVAALAFAPEVVIPAAIFNGALWGIGGGLVGGVGCYTASHFMPENADHSRRKVVEKGHEEMHQFKDAKKEHAKEKEVENAKTLAELKKEIALLKKTQTEHTQKLEVIDNRLNGVVRSQGAKSTFEERKNQRQGFFKPEDGTKPGVNVTPNPNPNPNPNPL